MADPTSPRPSKKNFFTVKAKLAIVTEHKVSGLTVYATAKKHGLQAGQVSRWIKNVDKLEQAVLKRPGKLTVGTGPPASNEQDDPAVETPKPRRVPPPKKANVAQPTQPHEHGERSAASHEKTVQAEKKEGRQREASASKEPRREAGAGTKRKYTRAAKLEDAPSDAPTTVSDMDIRKEACRLVKTWKEALGDQYMAAVDLLSRDKHAHSFLVVDAADQVEWLQWKLSQGHGVTG